MTGIVAVIADSAAGISDEALLASINPTGSGRVGVLRTQSAIFGACSPPVTPTTTSRTFESDRHVGLLFGDPVSDDSFEWSDIADRIFGSEGQHAGLAGLQGAFALIVYEKATGQISAVTDCFGFQPLYLASSSDRIIVSTALAPFLRFSDPTPQVDSRWVHEYLFFNYPVLERTLLQGVSRLPPGSVTSVGAGATTTRSRRYVPLLERSASAMSPEEEIEGMLSLFDSTVPRWFESASPVAFSLSRGLDSRAVLASVPASATRNVSTFTYGIPDSNEIVEAANLSKQLGYGHQELFLKEEYLARLPTLLHETVHQSDALQVINRSNLPLVYGSVRVDGQPAGAIMTGVSGDHVFRDHISAWGNVPYLISADVAAMHRTSTRQIDNDFYQAMFGDAWNDVGQYLNQVLDDVEREYGSFGDAEAYYRYLMYVAGSRYFGGQAAIANQYSTFRTPYWDRDMVQFGMDVQLGPVGLSERLEKKDKYLETLLQANVVARHPELRKVPYMNLPVAVFAKRSRIPYEIARVARKATTIVTGRKRVDEEDWPGWYRTVLRDEIDSLLGESSRVARYVRRDFIERQRAMVDIHWLGKLITVEIALRLAENGWRIAATR